MSRITIANLTFTILNFILLVLIIAASITVFNEAKGQLREFNRKTTQLSTDVSKLNTNTPN